MGSSGRSGVIYFSPHRYEICSVLFSSCADAKDSKDISILSHMWSVLSDAIPSEIYEYKDVLEMNCKADDQARYVLEMCENGVRGMRSVILEFRPALWGLIF